MIPAIGGDLMPRAMNVAHAVLFGVSLLLMKREQPARGQADSKIGASS